MVNIIIEGKSYHVNKKDNLLKICLELGYNLPYFCWHPRLGSVGSCRQCAIKQYDNISDNIGHIVMSCMSAPIEGMRFSIYDIETREFRKSIIEFMMINHPHDCPVCDEGGNCHLQDMTIMTQHTNRRYNFPKKIYANQYLGPFISHNMNRCIKCYRCVRFYKDYAQGTDLDVFGANNNIFFGRYTDGILQNNFSGNLIEVCPTGVFTDKINSKYYTRKWDLQYAPSVCQNCSLGCNLYIGERYGNLSSIHNRFHEKINHYFLCDKGYFGYDYIHNKNNPINVILHSSNNNIIHVQEHQIIPIIINILNKSKNIIGIGSPRASIESNVILKKLVGSQNFYSGISYTEQKQMNYFINILKNKKIHHPTLSEIENYDAIFIIGEDISVTSPRTALAVRQAIKNNINKNNIHNWHANALLNANFNHKNPLFITSLDTTNLDDISLFNYYAPVMNQVIFINAISHYIMYNKFDDNTIDIMLQKKIINIISILLKAQKCLIITGTNTYSIELLHATYILLKTLYKKIQHIGFFYTLNTVNSMGINIINGHPVDNIFNISNIIDTIIIIENDLYIYEEKNKIDKFLHKIKNIIVIDNIITHTTNKSTILLPAANFIESSGTVINNECRAQRFFQVYDPVFYNKNNQRKASWQWLSMIYNSMHKIKPDYITLDNIIKQCEAIVPELQGINKAAPAANFRINNRKFARSPLRYSGRSAIFANKYIHEPIQSNDLNTMFNFSMEGNSPENCTHMPYTWYPGWNSGQSIHKFQKNIGVSLKNVPTGYIINYYNINIPKILINIPKLFIKSKNLIIVSYNKFYDNHVIQKSLLINKYFNEYYAILNYQDAISLNIKTNNIIQLYCLKNIFTFKVQISYKLHQGLISLPLGISGIPLFFLNKTVEKLRILE
ncbi:NADH-quinone oxidoreductase subunit NuoG [Enterobacteriaceae endosymbiont of Neohaemonia nigricornis]|uniref:NADH-quinone oxidoreductase subunit NuoG n=1 Tax=Enterobacteriaceae endosymbiont of Neohaemonia nigricornis TaxID=2675792 RepID=UPI0014495364|nr:NADH-quinone oxidoreductase subunit NuoG [Enterobacteriaceae endosymbiont of Neohaemonia nigricornis]QJC30549.1 NADH-quinone oxidoreductase subunit NuoG [Enterobacteriaceae endosymbiont of Neohaemonia nigricornis]